MPDLHSWITQQIDQREDAANRLLGLGACPDWGHCQPDCTHENTDERVRTEIADRIRRCAADRRVLARHRLDPDVYYEPACLGCRTYGDQEMAYTDNLNDCPELLDLGYAHGLTPEILATLDRPQLPPRPERPDIPPPVHLDAIVRLLSAQPTSSVPPALRGPNWPGPA